MKKKKGLLGRFFLTQIKPHQEELEVSEEDRKTCRMEPGEKLYGPLQIKITLMLTGLPTKLFLDKIRKPKVKEWVLFLEE